jgi:hypothetical protein
MLNFTRFFFPVLLIFTVACTGPGRLAENSRVPGKDESAAVDTDVRKNNSTQPVPAGNTRGKATAVLSRDTLREEVFPDTLSRFDAVFLSLEDPTIIYGDALASMAPDTLCIIGTGDIMPGTNYPDERYLPPGNDCAALFDPVRSHLAAADVTFGNLEGVFSSDGGTPKQCKDPSVCYVFRMPDAYLECILDAGYDVLSVANNHVNDFGAEGRANTARLLEEAGIPFAGFRSHPYTTFEKNGVTYGFAAFAPHTGTVDMKDYQGAADIVAMLDSISDVVIVSFHGGAEGRDYQHVPCTDEVFLGHNRGNVCTFAHTVVDAGADVVFGHGPHVIRGMELYKERLICYSLGNFCTYARFNLSGPNGLAPIIKVYTAPDGTFLEGEIIPVYQPGEGGPRPDPRNLAIIQLKELSAADFPDSPLVIEMNGTFYAK